MTAIQANSFHKTVWKDVTAVFGGSFDPPHLGHRIAAKDLLNNPGVKRVVILPSGNPPQKSPNCDSSERLEMVRLNFSTNENLDDTAYPTDRIVIDETEVVRAKKAPQVPSFTIDSVESLKKNYGEIAFVIGADQLARFHSWHRASELLKQCHWLVLLRKPYGMETITQTLKEWETQNWISQSEKDSWNIQGSSYELRTVLTPAPSLSSTEIREAIEKRRKVDYSQDLHPEVLSFLEKNSLYQIKK